MTPLETEIELAVVNAKIKFESTQRIEIFKALSERFSRLEKIVDLQFSSTQSLFAKMKGADLEISDFRLLRDAPRKTRITDRQRAAAAKFMSEAKKII